MKPKNLLKNFIKIWTSSAFMILCICFIPNTYAQNNNLAVDWFNILPELTETGISKVNESIDAIWRTGKNVWNEYNRVASWLSTSQQIASWIMNRDTIMNYLVFIVQFLSQLWLVVWFGFIMYAWYKYMLSVFSWWKTPSSAIKNAIIWIIIVIFSYAIMKTLTSIIGIS
jgi:hypothetical protein